MLTDDAGKHCDRGAIRAAAIFALGLPLLAGCLNHYLVHPRKPAPQVVTWAADFGHDQIAAHIEGARPPGHGPFPTVLVFPEEDQTALDMRGVIYDLAARGYVAIAADYKRNLKGRYQRNYFSWRTTGDLTFILDVAYQYPEVDRERVGTLGFSEGGVLALLLAAHAEPGRVKAVVSYYPITDFPHWYAGKRYRPDSWVLFQLARWQFRVDADHPKDEELQRMLRLASPLYMADLIKAPVLMIHGKDDTLAPVEESERMAAKLRENGDTVKLLVIPGAGRLFNFHQKKEAAEAWQASVEWLDRYLRGS